MRHIVAGLFVVAMFSGAAWAKPFDYNARARPSDMGSTVRDTRSFDRASRHVELRDGRSEARSEAANKDMGKAFRRLMEERCSVRANGGCGSTEPF